MKEYQITYKPYTKMVGVKEFYEGATPEWEELIQDKYKDDPVYHVLNEWKSLQKSGLMLIKALDERQRKRSQNARYNIKFNGTSDDFQDLVRICEKIRSESDLLQKIELCTEFTDAREIIQTINSNLGYITSLYEGEFQKIADSLKQKIEEECNKAAEAELTVMVVGMQNSGKSTLINALIGKNLLPVSGDVETATLFTLRDTPQNYIRIIMENQCSEDDLVEIKLNNGKFQYNELTKELMEVLHDVNESTELQECPDDTARIAFLIKKINDKCKILQEERTHPSNNNSNINKIVLPKEIIIGLSGWSNRKQDNHYCIMDLPGAGVSKEHIGTEHQKLIKEKMNSVDNAVVVYVLKADSANDGSALEFLQTIKEDSVSESSNGHSRVDYDQSIYVLNKADAHEVDAQKISERYIDYKDGKWVLTSADAALQIRTKSYDDESLDESYISKFVFSQRKRPLIDFTSKSVLTSQYDTEYTNTIIKSELEGIQLAETCEENKDLMLEGYRRTGVPLVSALISEYAEKYAVVHKVGCYYNAVAEAIETLEIYEKTYKDDCLKYQENLRKTQKSVIAKLEKDIEAERLKYNNVITQSKVYTSLSTKMQEAFTTICSNLESWIKQAFSTETQTKEKRKVQEKQRKERDKEVKKQSKNGCMMTSTDCIKIDNVINWESHLADTINDYINKDVINKKLKRAMNDLANNYLAEVKKSYIKILADNTDENNLTENDIADLKNLLVNYNPLDLDVKYEIKRWSAGKTFLMLLQVTENRKANFVKEKIINSGEDDLTHYWSANIVTPCSVDLHDQLISEINKLTDNVLTNIKNISPSVVTIQNQLNEAEKKLSRLQEKLMTSKSYKEYCKELYETGVKK